MKFYSIEKSKEKNTNLSETFIIEPFENGQALTFANTIRRALLSETYGFAVTQVQINQVENEFEQASFLREDTLEFLLNIKQVLLKPAESFFKKMEKKNIEYKNVTKIKGPLIVTAGMLSLPKELIVLNPSQYICTITNNSELNLVLTIKYDKSYELVENAEKENFFEKTFKNEGFTLNLDTFFLPVKNVNYKIRTVRDTRGNLKESLILEIVTNGTITPKRAFLQAINSCLKLFYNAFVSIISTNDLRNKLVNNYENTLY